MSFVPFPECIQIRSDRVILRTAYEEIGFSGKKSAAQQANEENLKANTPAGHINRKIRLKMNRIIHNWLESVKVAAASGRNYFNRHFTFVTLTLPAEQMHTDKELHSKALNRFIQHLKRKHKLINYLWRAERQKNGNLHYHIICDTGIHWQPLRSAWNDIMRDLGYIDKYRQNQQLHHSAGFRLHRDKLKYWPADKQLKAYQEGVSCNWSNPNSTDIHSLKKVKDVAKYISKYCTKSDLVDELQKVTKAHDESQISLENFEIEKARLMQEIEATKINGRVWGCSDNIKELKDAKILECAEMYQLLQKIVDDQQTKAILRDECQIYYCNNLQKHLQSIPLLANHVKKHHLKNYQQAYAPREKEPPKIDISFFLHPEPEPALSVWKPFNLGLF